MLTLSMITCDHIDPFQSETVIFYSDLNKLLEFRIRGYEYIVLFECLLQEISENLERIQKRYFESNSTLFIQTIVEEAIFS